ncbi:BrnA antitoxin family protein [Polynucleobacter sp. JS-JIR-5-A7]|uniref:BrnA antitoxin family protein n=1 Tax=Polynucleobacter sp. JS-JIR-5-A7 TaxID=1758395 RepID=UPI001BFED6A8|nr:BrnA antitoxin family protein [Polynucleobacter sp. JS-JIR-5-A7]QWE07472.1 BrnA antitoxin family protein [Polynucleobacter sp. JS-JIR-5-A7]
MNVKLKNISKDWVDPDDAPELDEQWFRDAHVYVGDTLIKRGVGRPPIQNAKEMLSLRLDSDILEKLRASGKGWQTRLSKHIKEAVLKGAL